MRCCVVVSWASQSLTTVLRLSVYESGSAPACSAGVTHLLTFLDGLMVDPMQSVVSRTMVGMDGPYPDPPPDVATVFASYPSDLRLGLAALRRLILETADETDGVGRIEEALRWGQPSYLTGDSGSGSTIRLAPTGSGSDGGYAMYFICNTNLVDSFRTLFGDTFNYDGKRALVFDPDEAVPTNELRECIAMALTYHLRRKRPARSG